MKTILYTTIFSLTITSCSNTSNIEDQNNIESKKETVGTINKVVSQSEFKELMKNQDAQLIDVRTAEEFNEGFIPDAINLDFYAEDFKEQLSKLDKNKPVLIYCRSVNRSGQAAEMLKDMGFTKVYDLEGGFSEWKN